MRYSNSNTQILCVIAAGAIWLVAGLAMGPSDIWLFSLAKFTWPASGVGFLFLAVCAAVSGRESRCAQSFFEDKNHRRRRR